MSSFIFTVFDLFGISNWNALNRFIGNCCCRRIAATTTPFGCNKIRWFVPPPPFRFGVIFSSILCLSIYREFSFYFKYHHSKKNCKPNVYKTDSSVNIGSLLYLLFITFALPCQWQFVLYFFYISMPFYACYCNAKPFRPPPRPQSFLILRFSRHL